MKTKYTLLALAAFFSLILTSCDALMPKARRSKPSDDSIEESQLSISSSKNKSSSSGKTSKPSSTSEHQHIYSDVWSYDETYHWRESVCEHTGLRDKVEEHQFAEIENLSATYESDGYYVSQCVVCGYQKRVTIPKLVHNYASTYTYDDNSHWKQCIDPGFEDLRSEEAAHNLQLVASSPATNDTDGYDAYACLTCGYSKVVNIPATGHNYSDEWTSDATYHWHACTDAGYENLTADKSKHSFVVTESLAASYDAAGYTTYQCTVCRYSYTEDVAQLEHKFRSTWSWDETGHWHSCMDAGYENLRGDYAEHTYQVYSYTPATYDSPSKTVYACTVCSQQKTVTGEDQVNHNYSDEWTCDFYNHWHACIDEGYESLYSDLTAHDFVLIEHIEPTFENGGRDRYECSICHYGVDRNITGPLSHNYSDEWSYSTTQHWRMCIDEGYEMLSAFCADHELEYYSTNANNYHTLFCRVCGAQITEDYDGYRYRGEPIVDENGLMYFMMDDSSLAVYAGKTFSTQELVIPSDYHGLPVKRIMAEAFHNSDITSVVIPDSIEEIGSSAFSGCHGLSSIDIPSSVKRIGRYALGYNDFTSITIPSGVEIIDSCAFSNCHYLQSITIPDTVSSLASNAFDNCTGIQSYEVDPNNQYYSSENGVLYNKDKSSLLLCPHSISGVFTVPDNLSEIGEDAFTECWNITAFEVGSNNQYFSSVDGLLYNKNQTKLIRCPCGKVGDVVVPAPVTECASNSFRDCQYVTSIELPYGVTEIWDRAFYQCCSLSSVTIPNTVVRIGQDPFFECSELTSIVLPNSLREIGDNAFYGSYFAEINIPENVETINSMAFQHASHNTSVTVSENNQYFSSVDGVLYNKAMTKIIHCPALKEGDFVIPEGVTEMNQYAFYSAGFLTSISFPASFNANINADSFANCTSLLNIYVDSSNTSYCSVDGVVYSKDCTAICVAPRARTGTFVVPEGVTRICRSAFYFSHFNLVILPRSLTVIERDGFYVCDGLTELVILSCDVDFNNDYSIRACYYLENVYLTTTWGDSTYINKVREGIQYDVNIYFYSEEEPSTPNMFWHYVDGVPTIWP